MFSIILCGMIRHVFNFFLYWNLYKKKYIYILDVHKSQQYKDVVFVPGISLIRDAIPI